MTAKPVAMDPSHAPAAPKVLAADKPKAPEQVPATSRAYITVNGASIGEKVVKPVMSREEIADLIGVKPENIKGVTCNGEEMKGEVRTKQGQTFVVTRG